MCLGISSEARGAEMTPGPGGVVGTSQAVSSVRVANLGGALGVCVPVALTRNTILG